MKVILVEQHEVPIISLRVIVKAGSILDPPGKEGLANLTAQLLRRGTSTRTGEKIADEVDFVGGTLEIAAGHDLADLQAEFLKKDIGAGLEIVSDILRHPAFPIREVSKIVEQEIDAVLQEKDEPESAIEDFFDAYLFGKHPYARPAQGDELSISTIRRADVVRFYQKNYIPSAVTLVVAGDFTSLEMEKLILEKFDSWKIAPNATPVKLSSPQRVNGRKLLLIDKPDATQTFFFDWKCRRGKNES
jgi:predicted Zn-dependent peptidase